jgi:hypothetical protein
MWSFVADGNFKADHLKQKNDSSDVWLTNGEAFMTNVDRYEIHLQTATEHKLVGNIIPFLFLHVSSSGFRCQVVTGIEHNSMERFPTTRRTARDSEARHVHDMAVSSLGPWLISRRENDR